MINLRVMIVEDDGFLLKKIGKVLSREISHIYTFKNPIEAIKKVEEINPDIIISDINMPEMNGVDMYKELKKNNFDIPIILASAFSEPEYFIEAIKLKVKKFIVKPIDLEELVDELRQFEKELLNEKEILKQERMLMIQSKMAAMGEMLTNIAHQWRQPLNTISICTSNIKLEKEFGKIIDEDNTLDSMIENIMNSIHYMDTTLNDFQSYLKPNKLESCFYIKDTLEKIDKLIFSQMRTYKIEKIIDIEDFHLCNYQNELIQVLINIKKNAIEELSHQDKERLIKISTHKDDNGFVISIHDNAGGVPIELMEKIFEPYFTTKKESGTGIGLYMSRQIVENHLQGKLTVSNEEFVHNETIYYGAKFQIHLESLDEY
ncbi:response regulator [Poseidonibacter lekithochrous]|uniref:ATP-binding response regulator n=1 Tax=Poseidonibacter TaxID=2321187 RepID=UPI001C0880A9|nr:MULTISPECIES: response regulator [Poseidonibacter]MBU3014264.1 response regulator [Poseidonibacter lekithochrous]MDO6827561.1 response regulator [Poseidonibacter sp. 1_MG-2023]